MFSWPRYNEHGEMRRQFTGLLLFLSAMSGLKALAQADINMATHWYNRANYNPAFIARPEYLYAFSNIRHQWTGVEGAPQVFNLQVSEYIHSLRSAFGLSFINDKIGLTQASNPMLTYAYLITNDRDWSLSMGLSAGMYTRSIDGSHYEAVTINDPSLDYNQERIISPDANVGVEYLSAHFILGVSSTHLLSIGKTDDMLLNSNHRYGYVIYKNNNLKLFYYKVGILVVNRYNLTVLEGNMLIRFKHPTGLLQGPREIFDFGLSYRSSRQMTFLAGLLLTPDLRVGYAYDHSFARGYNRNGTHEIMIEYRIPSRAASTRVRCGTNAVINDADGS
jgi:type IX secretion system PorP/SprF family membrane protein